MAKKSDDTSVYRVITDNRKARHNYFVEESFEAGIQLTGSEVKSLRNGQASLADAYASEKDGEIFLLNCYIPEYTQANRFQHETRRPRKLLLHKKQITKLVGAVERSGRTLVPLKMYFNERGIAKVQIALATGKKLHDKRQTDKDRSWQREKARLLREKG